MGLYTPSAVLRTGAADIVEGFAFVPPRQFIRTSGGLKIDRSLYWDIRWMEN